MPDELSYTCYGILTQEVPLCQKCVEEEGKREEEGKWEEKEEEEEEEETPGVMKPDIVFFGEGLPDEFHLNLDEDKTKVSITCM